MQEAEAIFCKPFMRINSGRVADSEKKITAIDHIAHSGFRSNISEYGFDHFTSGSNDPDPIVGYPDVINEDPGPSNLGPNLIFLDPESLRGAGLYIFTLLIPDLDDILFLDTDPCVTQRLNSDIVYIFFIFQLSHTKKKFDNNDY